MNLIALTAFTENYIQMLHEGHDMAPDAHPTHPCVPCAILVTRHRADHVAAPKREVNIR